MDKEKQSTLFKEGSTVTHVILESSRKKFDDSLLEDSKLADYFLKGFEIAASEFHNPDFINWRRVRSLIEHENNLVNQRITWLLVSQGALLTPFGLLYIQFINAADDKKGLFVLPLIALAIIGPVICLLVYIYLRNASIQTFRVTKWWYRAVYAKLKDGKAAMQEEAKRIELTHTPLHYWRQIENEVYDRKIIDMFFFRIESIPIYFVFFWIILISLGIVQSASPTFWIEARTKLAENGFQIGGGMALGVIVTLLITTYRKRPINDRNSPN